MKPQPEQNGVRPVPPIHPDTIAFERHLRSFAIGQSVTYAELAAIVRKDIRANEGSIKAHIRTAERRLLNSEGMVFSHYHDAKSGARGRVRLDDVGIVNLATHRIGGVSRAARRVARLASCADQQGLTDELRHTQATVMLAARGAQRFTDHHGRDRIKRIVSNSKERIPELESAWKALQNGI